MASSSLLAVGVLASALFAAAALVWLVIGTFGFGRVRPRSGWKGVAYAFGRGMLPWEKESAGRHYATLAAGVLYHVGVFLALLQLFASALGLDVPRTVASFLRILLLASLVSGAGLLVKRAASPTLRRLSCPDDYAANLIVDLFLFFSFLTSVDGVWVNWQLAAGMGFFVYLPLGKIRHCLFFFYTRVLFGLFFGSRGVLPHPRSEAKL